MMPGNKPKVINLEDFLKRIQASNKKSEMKRGQIGKYSLTEDELNLLLSKISNIRDLALIKLASFTGIRREDIVAIELKDIMWTTGEIRYYEQKKRRNWSSYANPDTMNILTMYVATLGPHERYLFPGRTEKRGAAYSKTHLTGRAAYKFLQKWLIAAGLQKEIGPGEYEKRPFHALRSTCIKLLLRKGWPIEDVMRQTGDTEEVIRMHYTVPTESEMARRARMTETGLPLRDLSTEDLKNNLDGKWREHGQS